MALGADAFALDWDFEPYVGGSAIYTDNQNSSENDPQDALILTLTPGFSLRSEGSRRLRAGMNYSVTGVARFGDDLDNDAYQNLRALGNAELMEDFLFIDGTASISQQLISLSGSQADASVNSSNRTTTSTYTISPYVTQRFGNFAEGLARFTQSGALFDDNAFDNINSSIFNASLSSGTRFNDLSWGLNYFWRNAVVQNSEDARFESYGASLGYALTPRFRLLGTAGYDNNDYTSVPGSEISGTSWTTGFDWAPNVRTNLGASAGESYFGRTYGLDFNYRTRNAVWTANYDDGVSDISQQLLNTQPLFVWGCDGGLFFGNGVLPPQGQSNCVPLGAAPAGSVPVGLQNGIYLNKRFRAGVAWALPQQALSGRGGLVQGENQPGAGPVQYHPAVPADRRLARGRSLGRYAVVWLSAAADDQPECAPVLLQLPFSRGPGIAVAAEYRLLFGQPGRQPSVRSRPVRRVDLSSLPAGLEPSRRQLR